MPAESPEASAHVQSSQAQELLRLLRPYQWIKNVFVFAGVLFGGELTEADHVVGAIGAFVGFSLISSGVYVMNDLADRERDRLHPVKRLRPLAAGTVSTPLAIALGALLLIAGAGVSWMASPWVAAAVGLYVVLNGAYSAGLKHVVILDVFMIAGGFMLRLLAGTAALGIPPSQWLLLCGLMVALFLGFAKRRSELFSTPEGAYGHRRVLESYTPAMLDVILAVTATAVLITYSLYTVSPETVRIHGTEHLIYTVPFVLFGLFRYLFLLYRRTGGEDPSRELVRDPFITGAAALWFALTAWLLYGG